MGKRIDLHNKLQQVIGIRSDGKPNVYFQPPESVKLNFPCIVYKRGSGVTIHADDKPYVFTQLYEITRIDKDPDSEDFINKLALAFPTIEYVNHFVNDGLNHDMFKVYF